MEITMLPLKRIIKKKPWYCDTPLFRIGKEEYILSPHLYRESILILQVTIKGSTWLLITPMKESEIANLKKVASNAETVYHQIMYFNWTEHYYSDRKIKILLPPIISMPIEIGGDTQIMTLYFHQKK